MPAAITSLDPVSAAPGATVSVNGTGFVEGAAVRLLAFAAMDIVPSNFISAIEIEFTVPNSFAGAATVVDVAVSNPAEAWSNAAAFTVEAAPVSATAAGLCSLADLKLALGMPADSPAQDAHLAKLILMASNSIRGYCRRGFGLETVTDEKQDGDGTPLLRPFKTPLVSLTSLAIDGGAVDLADVKVYGEYIKFTNYGDYSARLRGLSQVFPVGSQNVVLTYVAGHAVVPALVADACIQQAIYLKNVLSRIGITSETDNVAAATTAWNHAGIAPNIKPALNRYRKGLAMAAV